MKLRTDKHLVIWLLQFKASTFYILDRYIHIYRVLPQYAHFNQALFIVQKTTSSSLYIPWRNKQANKKSYHPLFSAWIGLILSVDTKLTSAYHKWEMLTILRADFFFIKKLHCYLLTSAMPEVAVIL